jgi:hypothetical protein
VGSLLEAGISLVLIDSDHYWYGGKGFVVQTNSDSILGFDYFATKHNMSSNMSIYLIMARKVPVD